ncbi:MAG: MlaE family lipid ABC transporter permease subunit [Pseudanabaenaceae cyanobacterium]
MVWLNKLILSILTIGQVTTYLFLKRQLHWRNTLEQMSVVGTDSLLITLVTASFVGAVFTIQVAREFINFGATQAIGGVLALALSRELSPVLTAVIIAGRVGSAFAAEIGTMKISEQIDALYMLRSDPVNYLVTPRILAAGLMLPLLTVFAFCTGIVGGIIICQNFYSIPQAVFIDSVRTFLKTWDVIAAMLKSAVFGVLIGAIGTTWGLTTTGGAKGVGQSTTTAVVTSLLAIFASNFFLSWLFFSGIAIDITRGIG